MQIENFISLSDSEDTSIDHSHDAGFGITMEKLIASVIDPSKPLVSPRLNALLNIEKTIAFSKQHPELRDKLLRKISAYKASRLPDLYSDLSPRRIQTFDVSIPRTQFDLGDTSGSSHDSEERDIGMDSSQPISQITNDTQLPSDVVEFPDSQEDDRDSIVYIDIPIDIRSIQLPRPPAIPTVSNHEEMISAVEAFENDLPSMMSIIINSTNEYTPRQRNLIEEIRAEYDVYQASSSRNPQFFQNRLHAFTEDLATQLLHQNDEPTFEELEFFEDQRAMYRKIHDVLIRSAFPFSAQQNEYLSSYRRHMHHATGNPDADADVRLMNDLRRLINLMAENDHIDDSSSHRFYIDCTIEYHAHKIVHDLEFESFDERTRVIPSSIPEGSMVNIANFLSDRIKEIFCEIHPEEHGQIFHYGLREVYDIVNNIFRDSTLSFSVHQAHLIQSIHESVREIRGNASRTDHEIIHQKFLRFMDSLKQEHPERELMESNGVFVVDPHGVISKTVKDITWDLLHMQKVTEDHLESFPDFASHTPNIIKIITHQFLRIYPRNTWAPRTSGPGGSSSH